MGSKGFTAIENKLEKLAELIDPSEKEPLIITLIETFNAEGNETKEIAIQPETGESFLVVEEDKDCFDFDL